MRYGNRIVIDPKIMQGKPVIKGTRIPVYVVLNLLAGGLGKEEILKGISRSQLRRTSLLASGTRPDWPKRKSACWSPNRWGLF